MHTSCYCQRHAEMLFCFDNKKKSTNVSGTVSIMSPRALSLALSEKPRRASKAFISEVTLKTEFVLLKDR